MKKRQAEKIVLRWYNGALYRSGTVERAIGVAFRDMKDIAFMEVVERRERTSKNGVCEVVSEIPALC